MMASFTCHICDHATRDPAQVRLGYCSFCNAIRIEPGDPQARLAHMRDVILKAATEWEAHNARKPDNPRMRALVARHRFASFYDFLRGRKAAS